MNLVRSLSRPSNAFWIALVILLPVNVASVMQNEWFTRPPKPVGDGLDYENIAYHLFQGRGYVLDSRDPDWQAIYLQDPQTYSANLNAALRTLFATGRPPLFPTIVAGIYCMAGRTEAGFASVRLFSATCLALSGAIAAAITALVLRDLKPPGNDKCRQFAILLGVLATIGFSGTNRTLRSYANDFLTEPLALLLTQLFVLTILTVVLKPTKRVVDSGTDEPTDDLASWSWFRLAVAGTLLGAMILTRSIFVVWLPGIWVLAMLSFPGSSRMRAGKATCLILIAVLCCGPWWVRNVMVLDRLMPLGTQGPITLLGGYSDAALAAGGDWQPAPEQQLRQAFLSDDVFSRADDTVRETMVSTAAGLKVRHWIAAHTADLPNMFLARAITHWNPYSGRSLIWKLLIVVGVVGLIRYSRRTHSYGIWLIGGPVLSTFVAVGLYTVGGRFLVPMYGLMFALAGLGVAFVCQFSRDKC